MSECGKASIGFHLSKSDLKSLRQLAVSNDRSLSAEIRIAIRNHLKEMNRERS